MVSGLGVSKSATGIFMAITYIAVAAGSMLTPRILKYYTSVNRLSLLISILIAISLVCMGIQKSYTGLLISTAAYWFLSGVQINIYSIIMSYITPQESVGKSFGLLANTVLTGAVVGSFVIGPLIHFAGSLYGFLLFGIVTIASRFAMALTDFDIVYREHKYIGDFKANKKLWLLLFTLNAGIMLSFIGRFNLSLIMKEHHYTLGDISYIFALGSLIVFPLPYVFGLLSQKVPNKFLLCFTLACVSLSMFVLYRNTSWFSFLSVSFLIGIMTYCSRGVSQKIIYDIYPLKLQLQAQAALTSTNWVAGILGFLSVSFTSGIFSLQQISLFGCVMGVISMVILLVSPFTNKQAKP
jgi:MFS family permease